MCFLFMDNVLFLRSMTAYGRAICDLEDKSFLIEITSVNRKHLEINFNSPKYLQCLEIDFRKVIASCLSRGNVQVSIRSLSHKNSIDNLLSSNSFSRITALKLFLDNLRKDLGICEEVSLELLLKYIDLYKGEFEEQCALDYKVFLKEKLQEALSMLITTRETEGHEIGKNIVLCLALLSEFVNKIKEFIPEITKIYRKKITNRILELEIFLDDRNKLLKEISLLIEKIDITEEVVRTLSHLKQMRSVIEKPFCDIKETKGKQLEFLTQEILRELNTMNVKSSELAVTKLIIDAKIELEKIREQLQNIE